MASLTATPAVEFADFALAHQGYDEDHALLEHVTLVVPRGGFFLVVGESGSGKSSLLRLICGLVDPRELPPRVGGALRVLGRSVTTGYPSELRRAVIAVLQDEGLLDELSPRANVELALRAAGRSEKLGTALLALVGLEHPPAEVALLSGGMRKRAAVARALGADPELLLFDEPTSGLDAAAARQIAELLKSTHDAEQGRRTTLVITHDLDAFGDLAGGVLALDRATRSLALLRPGEVVRPRRVPPADRLPAPDPVLRGLRAFVVGVGALIHTFGEAILRLPPVYAREALRSTARYLVEPVLFTILAAVTIGGLSTFFALRNNPLEGAFTEQVLTGVGKVLVAVLVPLMAGFFFTARMAAGAAARIGTMMRTNQVAALQMIGVRPSDWLLTPLVWSMCIAMPIVTFAGIVCGALASLAAARLFGGLSTYGWSVGFWKTVDLADARWILVKSILAGFFVAVITYHVASAPKRSGRDVGDAVNASIVLGMVTVLVVHAGVTVLAYD